MFGNIALKLASVKPINKTIAERTQWEKDCIVVAEALCDATAGISRAELKQAKQLFLDQCGLNQSLTGE